MAFLTKQQKQAIDSLVKGKLSETVEKLIELRKEYGGLGIFPNISIQDVFHIDGEDMRIEVSIALNPVEEEEEIEEEFVDDDGEEYEYEEK